MTSTISAVRGRSSELAAYAANNGLQQLGGRPPLFAYVRELWDRRHFAFELARSRVRSQNEQDRLGLGWVVLTPLINAAVYGFIFGILLQSKNSRPDHFLAFLVCGVFTFAFFSGCFQDGARSIISNRGLVRTLHFPRAVLPLASVVQQLIALGPMVLVMCAIVLIDGEWVTWRWLRLIPAYLLMSLFCAGVAFVAARLTLHLSDITQLIPFVNRLLFYVSGIFFAVGHRFHGTLAHLLIWNPVNVYITLVRDALLNRDRAKPGVHASLLQWELGVGYAVVLFVVGFIFFWRAEGLYGRD